MKALICCLLFCLPLKHLSITSDFGYRVHPITGKYAFHAGTDFRAHHDTVFAITSGRATPRFDPVLGIYVRIISAELEITYGHLSEILAIDSVNAGDPIAITGYAKC